MKPLSIAIIIAATIGGSLTIPAHSTEVTKIVKIANPKKPLIVYSEPDKTSASKEVPAAELPLPLAVLAIQNGFQQVQLPDGRYWIQSMYVVNAATVNALQDCTTPKTLKTVASTPGIGASACK